MTDIDLVHDSLPALSFQRVENYVAPISGPTGLSPNRRISILKLMISTKESVTYLASVLESRLPTGETFRVFLDPVGHPFCLIMKSD